MLFAAFVLLVVLSVLAIWLLVSPLLAGLVIVLSALAFGAFFASGIGAEWLGTRGRTFFDKDRR